MSMQTERLWKIWWLWGIPVAWATSLLIVGAELARLAGYHDSGNLLDVVRLAVYWFWFRLAWQCSRNVDRTAWTPVARTALVLGLIGHALA
jgi:hypothetical protein